MKITLNGTMTLNQFAKNLKEVISNTMEKVDADAKYKVHNPVVHVAFEIKGQEQPVYIIAGHGEIFDVQVDVDKGVIVKQDDNEEVARNQRILKRIDAVTNTPTTAIESIYFDFELVKVEEHDIKEDLKQVVYNFAGEGNSDRQLIRYFNTKLNVLVAEEEVDKKKEA
jgi:hypothetical protein